MNRLLQAAIAIGLAILPGGALRSGEDAANNLLINGHFEDGEPGPGSRGRPPKGWLHKYGSHIPLEIVSESRPGSSGRQCLKIGTDPKVDTSGVYSELIPLDPKKALIVSGWLKASGSAEKLGGAYLGIAWYDAERKPIVFLKGTDINYVYVAGSYREERWREFSRAYRPGREGKEPDRQSEIPPNAAFCEIRAFVLNYPKPAFFDDIEVRQMDPGSLPEATSPSGQSSQATSPRQKLEGEWAVGWKGGPKAQDAARILAERMAKVLGTSVSCGPWEPNEAKHAFMITDASHAPPEIAKQLEGKRLDAFTIQYPVELDNRPVCLLISHDDQAYDYPVYFFLTKFLDVHWVGPGEIGIVSRPQPGWRMPDKIDLVENPDFEMRMWGGESFSSREWLARSGRMGFHHALGHIFHPAKHGHTPEVYPLVGGKRYIPDPKATGARALSGWQPCTSHPKSIEIALQHVLEAYAKNPNIASVSLSVNDGAGNTCECELCRAQDAKDAFQEGQRPNLSDRFFRFYNEVSRRAREQNPRARIAVLGYGAVKTPPKEIKVDPYIYVFHVMPAVENLRAWKAAGAIPNIYLWLWDGGFLTIRPDMRVIAEIVRACYEMGGIGLYSEIIPFWAITAPKFYILAHVLWDTRRDAGQLLAEYCRLAYGEAAAPHMCAFFEKWWEIYCRRPRELWHESSWGWRRPEQMQYLRRDDLAAMDDLIARAEAADSSPDQRQRIGFVATYYRWLRINAQEFLAAQELSDPNWLSSQNPEHILDAAEAALPLAAQFDEMWRNVISADRTGWLLDARYWKNPDALWDQFLAQLRVMISSARETATDDALRFLTEQMLRAQPKEKVILRWEAEMKKRPKLAPYIGPQINALKGVKPVNIVTNGNFEEGEPGDPPTLPGWDFYQFYGMVKGAKAQHRWEKGTGHDGGRAIGMGEGQFPEMKAIIQMEAGRRYALSFWYKTVGRDRGPSFSIFSYEGPLESPRNIEANKIFRFLEISLEPTEGEWRRIRRTLTPPRTGVYVIQLAAYYQKQGVWTWFDDIQITPIW